MSVVCAGRYRRFRRVGWFGWRPVFDRFGSLFGNDGEINLLRFSLWEDVLRIGADFPAVGTGLGSLVDVYPAYRNVAGNALMRHAHNDYAETFATLWLYDENAEGGKGQEIWSSGDTDTFGFQIDSGQVIEGWDRGVTCMKIGEIRQLRIAPELGYGARGKPPVPPHATLLFEIELIDLPEPG